MPHLKSPSFAHPTKAKFGFTVNCQSIEFDNLVVRQLKSDTRVGMLQSNGEPRTPAGFREKFQKLNYAPDANDGQITLPVISKQESRK
ncbi:hypothetical protein NZK35_31855 [Stieleria sp. ICT_E10.1]|uniref:hypothetical protein n=1 Tax=Stieleria sedimenti TaxID=2976331 RepID=UPI0021800307|nr:hypothetical protein [Stieleria sedimenti]MCS7471273.1 hypothetical protein [Stieleria sedimenti]